MISKVFAANSDFHPLTDIGAIDAIGKIGSPLVTEISGKNSLAILFNQAVYVMLAIAIALAIFMIIRGGYSYIMSADNGGAKSDAKGKIQAAFGGLLLALGAFVILQFINPEILKVQFDFPGLERMEEAPDIYKDLSPEKIKELLKNSGAESYGSWTKEQSLEYIKTFDNISKRKTDGSLNITNYWNGDSNTDQQRGNADNLLRDGSVALSTDIQDAYKRAYGKKLPVGSEVFVNGKSVGFFEDTAGLKGQWSNTIDIYDPNKKLGSVLKGKSVGEWNITFGNPRPQVPNPSKK